MTPETKYASSGSVNVAYQVFGKGNVDLVVVPGRVSNIDTFREEPSVRRFFQRLAGFARVILFDEHGAELSDRVTETPTIEEVIDLRTARAPALSVPHSLLMRAAELIE